MTLAENLCLQEPLINFYLMDFFARGTDANEN